MRFDKFDFFILTRIDRIVITLAILYLNTLTLLDDVDILEEQVSDCHISLEELRRYSDEDFDCAPLDRSNGVLVHFFFLLIVDLGHEQVLQSKHEIVLLFFAELKLNLVLELSWSCVVQVALQVLLLLRWALLTLLRRLLAGRRILI